MSLFPQVAVYAIAKGSGPLRVIISGAPASGKGTQCETIVKELGLTHISAGDLLRAEVAAGTPAGKTAKEHMERGELVPDEIVTTMVKNRLMQDDAQTKGWLLDGYPRSGSQAASLEKAGIRPELVLILDVPDEILVERVVGRRQDPVTGKIYHLTFSPPETEEIAKRLTQRFDDTEEKCKARLVTHKKNEAAVVDAYKGIIVTLDGNRARDAVFADIKKALAQLR
jgi:adenylate kinase